jgi:hypothetical protein
MRARGRLGAPRGGHLRRAASAGGLILLNRLCLIMHAVRSPILACRGLRIVALFAAAGAIIGCAAKSIGTGSSREAVLHRSCPLRDLTFRPSSDARTATVLVPVQPIGVLVCRYWGRHDTGRPWTLAGHRYVAKDSKLAGLVAKLDALKPFPIETGGSAVSCPEFGGRSVLLLFQYRDASDDPLRIDRGGCVSVSNGRQPDLWGEGLSLGEHWPDEGVL